MRIGRLFTVSMLSVTVLTVVLGAGVLVPQYRTFASKTEAIKAVEAYGTVLAVGQHVAGYRAPYVGPLFQEAAATPAQLETAAKAVQAADAAFAKARTVVGALSDGPAIVQGLNQAAAKLAEVRTASDRAMAQPMSARDTAAMKGFLPGIAAVVGILEPLLNRLESQVAMADASLTALLNVARTSQDLRISAGGRAATVSLAISTRARLTAAEISVTDRAQGRVDLDRERIEAGVGPDRQPAAPCESDERRRRRLFRESRAVARKRDRGRTRRWQLRHQRESTRQHDRAGGAGLLRRARCRAGGGGRTRRAPRATRP
jgi:hypothetical protein